ncbi:hypothetical protein GOC68_31565 [Sinorhizobium medicae]|nr:hypothetical protein [Sinorhizobium medicae]
MDLYELLTHLKYRRFLIISEMLKREETDEDPAVAPLPHGACGLEGDDPTVGRRAG